MSFVDKFNSYSALGTGTDKLFRNYIYLGKVLIWYARLKINLPKESLQKIATFVEKTSGPLGTTRTCLRLLHLPAMWVWFKATLNRIVEMKPTQTLSKVVDLWLEFFQTISMLIYYPTEHISFFGSLGAINMSEESINRYSQRSCQAWFVYIVLDMIRDIGRLTEIRRQLDTEENFVDLKLLKELKNTQQDLLFKFIINLADAVLALNWSNVSKGKLSDPQVGFIGSISSVFGLILKWSQHK